MQWNDSPLPICSFFSHSSTLAQHTHSNLLTSRLPQIQNWKSQHTSKLQQIRTYPHSTFNQYHFFTQCSNYTLHYMSVKLVLCGQWSKRLMSVTTSSGNKWIWVHLDCFYGHEILHLEGAFHSKSARPQALYHLRRQFKSRRPPRGLEDWTMDIWSLQIWEIRPQRKKEIGTFY